jgi:hypothetical protein
LTCMSDEVFQIMKQRMAGAVGTDRRRAESP